MQVILSPHNGGRYSSMAKRSSSARACSRIGAGEDPVDYWAGGYFGGSTRSLPSLERGRRADHVSADEGLWMLRRRASP
jgi:hypothetical protein